MSSPRVAIAIGSAFIMAALSLFPASFTLGENSKSLQRQIDELRAVVARDRKQLMHYTWTENVTVNIKGNVVKQAVFRVHIDGSGKLIRTPVSASPAPGASQYDQYGKQLIALAQRYTHLDANRLRQLQAAGHVDIRAVGPPGVSQLDIDNYAKPGDAITLNFNASQKALLSYIVFTYLNNPSDDVGMSVTCGRLPDGTTYLTGLAAHSDSRNADILLSNSDFKRDR